MNVRQMIDKHSANQQSAREISQRASDEMERLRKESRNILEAIVLPVLKEMRQELNYKNHEAEVMEKWTGEPSLELQYSPEDGGTSRLRFTHSNSGIHVHQQIKGIQDDLSFHDEWALEDVSKGKVKKKVLKFVATTLGIE